MARQCAGQHTMFDGSGCAPPITQVMTTQKPQTAEAFKVAFATLADQVRTWRESPKQKEPARCWRMRRLWTMQQLATLFADYYAPPPAS